MKRIGFSVLALIAAAGTAAAADLPSRRVAPAYAPVAMATSWTGLYVGVNASYNFLGRDVIPRPDGFAVGARIGYDYQFNNNIVLGAFVDGDYAFGRKTSELGTALFRNSVRNSHEYTISVNARLGYAFGQTLLYVTGGYSYAQLKFRNITGPLPAGPFTTVSGTANANGWNLGAGIEHKFTQNLSGFVEYRYHQVRDGGTASINQVKAGVNYRF